MYVVTGATGNTGRVVANRLLDAGRKVRVISRNAGHLKPFLNRGAEAYVADLSDRAALGKAFNGAEAIYAMIPPDATSQNFRAEQRRVSEAIAGALEQSGVKYVVALSSVGADKDAGTGPVLGLHEFEKRLDQLKALNAVYLRAGYFMENTLGQPAAIHAMGKMPGPLRGNLKLPFVAAQDIGIAAADLLLKLDFTGKQARELLGQRDLSYDEVAAIIGRAMGKPDLRYVQFPGEQIKSVFIKLGMSEDVAGLILEMSEALNSGHMTALEPRSRQNTTPTSFETFAAEHFAPDR